MTEEIPQQRRSELANMLRNCVQGSRTVKRRLPDWRDDRNGKDRAVEYLNSGPYDKAKPAVASPELLHRIRSSY